MKKILSPSQLDSGLGICQETPANNLLNDYVSILSFSSVQPGKYSELDYMEF